MRLSAFVVFAILVSAVLGAYAGEEVSYDLSDPAEMVLAVENNGTRFSWQLQYGQARQRVIKHLAAGENQSALQAAKMQFILCPPDELSITAAIDSVKGALRALDANDTRANAFEEFARLGPAGPDKQKGTPDDLDNPIADVAPQAPPRDEAYYREVDRTMDARSAISEEWQTRWYETEKIFARLDGGAFDEALRLAAAALAESIKHPHGNVDGDWELQRNQDIIDRIDVSLGVVYRARSGTVAGMFEFIESCKEFALYGPAGKDDRMGTADDLAVPI